MSIIESGIAAKTGMKVQHDLLPIAGVGHIQNLGDNNEFALLSPAEAGWMNFDPKAILGDNPHLDIRTMRHIGREREYMGYHRGYESRQVSGHPLVFSLLFSTQNYEEKLEAKFSPLAAASCVSIHLIPNNGHNSWNYYNYFQNDAAYLRAPQAIAEFELNGVRFPVCSGFSILEKLLGAKVTKKLTITMGGREIDCSQTLRQLATISLDSKGYNRTPERFDFTFATLGGLKDRSQVNDPESLMNLVWGLFVGDNCVPTLKPARLDGITKVYSAVEQLSHMLYQTHPLHYIAFRSWVAESHRGIDGVKVSSVFNAAFKDVVTKEQMIAILDPMVLSRDAIAAIKETAVYKAKRKTHLKNTTGRAFVKLMQDRDFLNLDRKEFPLLDAAIEAAEVPIGVFFRKEEQYFLLNGNFPLWEEMLTRFPAETKELAQAAGKRAKFEKDLMSYFYFVLYALPEYLHKHTGKKWTCSPRLVTSERELDAPEDDGSGIRRERSALTPHVDNEKRHVVVPYASLRIAGQKIQWCYSHDYHVLTRGFSFNGNVVSQDLETKLNGKDDYGLMFYTLTGSETAQGYPTFLIIFEKRVAGVHVHFHRTHPSRSKDGDYNPIHDWIKVCYNWMAGNVLRSTLKYQQGDLLFIPKTSDEVVKIEGFAEGQIYDNHWFEEPVQIAPSTIKSKSSNILGWVKLEKTTRLLHKEHDPVTLDAGAYEIRQCRSWEANPRGIWSLRID